MKIKEDGLHLDKPVYYLQLGNERFSTLTQKQELKLLAKAKNVLKN